MRHLHHRNLIGDELHDRQVVGNEEIGQVAALLQFVEEVENFAPVRTAIHYRDTHSSQTRNSGSTARALARKGVGVVRRKIRADNEEMSGREPDFLEERNHPFATIGRSGADLVNRERFR